MLAIGKQIITVQSWWTARIRSLIKRSKAKKSPPGKEWANRNQKKQTINRTDNRAVVTTAGGWSGSHRSEFSGYRSKCPERTKYRPGSPEYYRPECPEYHRSDSPEYCRSECPEYYRSGSSGYTAIWICCTDNRCCKRKSNCWSERKAFRKTDRRC